MTEAARDGEQPVERGAAEENSSAPVTQTEVDASRRPSSVGDSDIVTEDDGSGTSGGSSGGSGGGSSMPGHPDAAQ
ncbi:preprotein translocase YidC [Couchioplanes caeruleus]|uniref:preprotein translocase YidC n=1 Tax=Couchioplanes caeruleus TaxID=56438 RepID=UPI0020BDB621|nr:preprotein translocase YidC [Couchioplanes caeruleus]UQU61920.1 preprotein translocase YidC [Couchioplanes caeruleus]